MRRGLIAAMTLVGGCLSNPTPHPAVDAFAGRDAFEDPASGSEPATDGLADAASGCGDAGDVACDAMDGATSDTGPNGADAADGADGPRDSGPSE